MNGSHIPTVYFSLESQTVDALEITLESLQRVPGREASWKWVVVGMHAALHGSFCLVLERTDGAQLLVADQEEQFWERVARERASGTPEPMGYTTRKGKPADEKVDWFLELFAKVQDADRMSYLAGVPLKPTSEQVVSIEELHWRRGKLIHPGSGLLKFHIPSLLHDLKQALAVVETLLTRTQYMSGDVTFGPIDTMVRQREASRARQLILEIRGELAAVGKRYELLACGVD